MEVKTVILSVLIMSVVIIAQIQVEAKSCCPSMVARNLFNACRYEGRSMSLCARLSGCKILVGNDCPPGYIHDILENPGDAVNEYCKLGCASSVCGALITLEDSDASEIVNGAVDQCTKTCSTFCSKGSVNSVAAA